MTNTETTPTSSPTAVPFDPRPDLGAVLVGGGEVIAAVTADHDHLPTPCDEFDVEALLGHLLLVANRIVAITSGRPAVSVTAEDDLLGGRTPTRAWDDAAATVVANLADDDLLTTVMCLPFADLPGFAALGVYTSEVLTHTWDLAAAIGLERDWDQEVAARCLATMERALPDEGRDAPEIPFAPAVPTPEDAPAVDRLVAHVGRNPRWAPSAPTAV